MNKPYQRLLLYAFALPLLLSAAGCKKQVATGTTAPTPSPVAAVPPPEFMLPPDLKAPAEPTPTAPQGSVAATPAAPTTPGAVLVDVQNFDYNYLQFKSKVQYENGNDKQEAQVSIRMKRDSIIWASISKVGFEGLRVILTPDTVIMLNRLQKSYFAGSFSALKRRYKIPVTFQQLQAALVANYLPAESIRDASGAPTDPVQTLHHDQEKLAVEQFINREKKRLVKLSVADQRNGNTLTANYEDFKPIKLGDTQREFPYALLLTVLQPVTPNPAADVLPKTLLISLNHKAVTVPDGQLEFPLSVPADYERK